MTAQSREWTGVFLEHLDAPGAREQDLSVLTVAELRMLRALLGKAERTELDDEMRACLEHCNADRPRARHGGER